MPMGIRTVGFSGCGGVGSSSTPFSAPEEQANRKILTTEMYKHLFNNLFIIIDFKFCYCRIIIVVQNYTIYVNTTSSQ